MYRYPTEQVGRTKIVVTYDRILKGSIAKIENVTEEIKINKHGFIIEGEKEVEFVSHLKVM